MTDVTNLFAIQYSGKTDYFQTGFSLSDILQNGLNTLEVDTDIHLEGFIHSGNHSLIDAGKAAHIDHSENCDCYVKFDYDSYKVEINDYNNSFEMQADISELARVVNALDTFCEEEYDTPASFEQLDYVPFAYTIITDFDIPLQVSVDLLHKIIEYNLEGDNNELVAKTEQYSSLANIAEAIEGSSFDDWVTVYDLPADKIQEYIEKNNKKITLNDGTECFVVTEWTGKDIDGDIPVEYVIGANFNNKNNDFEYYMQAYITDGEYKGYYLAGNVYDNLIKEDVVSALTDKIAELAIDMNEKRAEPFRDDEELDLTERRGEDRNACLA